MVEFETKPKVDFIGVGVNKSGSKWIYKCLSEHPEICFSKRKETHFFNKNYNLGFTWYAQQYKQCDTKALRGEFSPEYIDEERTITRIHSDYPHAKILLIIREPIDRLRSSWEFDYRRGRHNYRKFEEYLQIIDQRLLEKNLYYTKIKHLLNYFPREQIHIMMFDDIKNNPEILLRNLYTFLNVDHTFMPSVINKKINSSKSFEVKVRFVNNAIFGLRTLKNKMFGEKLNPILHFFRVGKLATYLHKINKSEKISTINLDSTLSENTKKHFQRLFNDEIRGLKNDLLLDVPKTWQV